METIGELETPLRGDLFSSLLRSIVGQQISVHAANAVWSRMEATCVPMSPETYLTLTDDDLRQVGMSRPKASYTRDLSQKVISREIPLAHIPDMQDEEIIEVLTKVKGIGRWTAEMLLVFTLGRPDVFAVDDLGLQKAVQ